MKMSIFSLELKEETLTWVKKTTCCSAGHRCKLGLAFGASTILLACVAFDRLFVYDRNEQTCDETKTTEKQYLAPEADGFFGEHSERSNSLAFRRVVRLT